MRVQQLCGHFLAYCQTNKQLSEHTINAYALDLRVFSTFIGRNKKIQQCGRSQIRSFIRHEYERGLSKATIKRRIACLKVMFRWLELDEIIEVNPFHKLDTKVRLPSRLPNDISDRKIKILFMRAREKIKNSPLNKTLETKHLSQIKRHINDLNVLICIELLFYTGVRVSELSNIKMEHINLEENNIFIIGKGNRERHVFVPDSSLKKLIIKYISLRYLFTPEHDTFLINRHSKPLSPQMIRLLIHTLSKKCQIQSRVTPHMFRHTNATKLLERDVDIRYVQKLLGHNSISTTQIYTHVKKQDLLRKVTQSNIRELTM